MTKPTAKPTVASLQKDLSKMRDMMQSAQGNFDAVRKVSLERKQELAQIRADLAPLLAYLQSGWLGPVQGNYQRLKRFVEGK